MATIKSYTDLEQSKKLAKILPIESADKHWIILDGAILRATVHDYFDLQEYNQDKGTFRECIPCWSLASLLSILPKIDNYRTEIRQENNCFCCAYTQKDNNGDLYWYYADNPVDACVAMIEKLHELKLLQL